MSISRPGDTAATFSGAVGSRQGAGGPVTRRYGLRAEVEVFERFPDQAPGPQEWTRPGLNHLGFHATNRAQVDELTAEAPRHGWSPLYADRHPHAGGPDHYAAYLEDTDGYQVEIVAP